MGSIPRRSIEILSCVESALRIDRTLPAALLPVAVAALLCLPCLRLGYFWDDFYFLTLRGSGDALAYLLPRPHEMFYRPISQGAYFLLLRLIDPSSGTIGHVVGLILLCAAILVLVRLTASLCGERAGLIAGLVFAASGCVPSLVAWVSCIQDLLAILLVLTALLLRHERKEALAIVSVSAAILSKEIAVVALPVLILWDRLIQRDDPRLRFHMTAYTGVGLVWFLIHTGMHELAAMGFLSGRTGYVGIEHPERWMRYLGRYLLTLVNIAPPGFSGAWEKSRVLCGSAALGLLLVAYPSLWFVPAPQPTAGRVPSRRVLLIASVLMTPTLLVPVVAIRHWAPYFACMPAAMFAILVGSALSRSRNAVILVALSVFLILGVRYRGARPVREASWTESVMVDASAATTQVRTQFAKLFPTLPHGSYIMMSVGSTGVRGIQSTMIDGQALQAWYKDPSIHTVPILGLRKHSGPEYLVRITPEQQVLSIDPERRRIQVAIPHTPDITEIIKPIMTYARARAASGDIDAAVRIATTLAEADTNASDRAYYRRMSASFLFSAGRDGEADSVLAHAPAFPRVLSLGFVKRLLAEPSLDEQVDVSAFRAFGLSYDDADQVRWIMREFVRTGSMPQAAWMARRFLELRPRDAEGTSVIRAAEAQGVQPSRMP